MSTVKKYKIGNPVETEAVTADVETIEGLPELGNARVEDGIFKMSFDMDEDDIVYGLGESPRGMNKRGWEYIQYATDDPEQVEDRRSLYAAHNFIILDGKKPVGLFVDNPETARFDIGYTRQDRMEIEVPADLNLYVVEGDSPYEIAKAFRKVIGKSYIPPKYAFGFGQSRWGYKSKDDFRSVAANMRKAGIPMDMLYMDIDYMQDYKDFTLNEKEFGKDFPGFVQEMKDQNIHLIPIIDAGIKKEAGYDIYEEGVKGNYLCKLSDHRTDFVGAVWPGYSVFPDVLNSRSREWFGNKYGILTEAGIDGFWNDMNEPALFYSEQGLNGLVDYLKDYVQSPETHHIFELGGQVAAIKNSPDDYRRFWHNMDGRWVRHDKVHNLYGYYMTRAAKEAFDRLRPDQRTLMFSRSSYIGMHRYGGLWTGDNKAWWSHILLLISQLPALNMSGFLYTGADLGGFGADTTRDLLARFTQLGVFTPLMRNHACEGTRDQEPYRFEKPETFAHLTQARYRLLHYLYSEYMKAATQDDLMFKPLAFVYPDDEFARHVEDQLMIGDEIMITPVYTQNAKGRYVYLPEEMMLVTLQPDGKISEEIMEKGHHYIEYGLDDVRFFVRKDRAIPLVEAAMSVPEIDMDTIEMIGYDGAAYDLYDDDGVSSDLEKAGTSVRRLMK